MTAKARRRAEQRIQQKYPEVDERFGYIPAWVYFFEGYPVLSKVIMSIAGAMSGALLMLLILLK